MELEASVHIIVAPKEPTLDKTKLAPNSVNVKNGGSLKPTYAIPSEGIFVLRRSNGMCAASYYGVLEAANSRTQLEARALFPNSCECEMSKEASCETYVHGAEVLCLLR